MKYLFDDAPGIERVYGCKRYAIVRPEHEWFAIDHKWQIVCGNGLAIGSDKFQVDVCTARVIGVYEFDGLFVPCVIVTELKTRNSRAIGAYLSNEVWCLN